MGLMDTPGGRSRLMRGTQNRASVINNQGPRVRDEPGLPERFRKNAANNADIRIGRNQPSTKRASANTDLNTSTEPQQTHAPLAIAPFMPTIMKTFHENQVMIVQAPTGTGKSIGISEAIVEAGYKLIVTNPRRIGAVLLAEHLAERDGSPLGEKFGYRHGRRKEADVDCQAVLTTEGYHLKVMLNRHKKEYAPQLDRNQKYAVMWDEAHERTARGAIMLALWKEMMLDGYDIKLVISSATINPKPIVDYFAKDGIKVPVIEIPVKHHEIKEVQHHGKGSLADDIASADRSLTFVHGKGAIAELSDDVALLAPGVAIIPLHAELSHKEQQESVEYINSGVGRIAVLSTNYSQASVTYDIDRVISSGLVRRQRMGVDGEPHLTIEESSQAEEMQKRGRAGRLRPGEWSYRGPVPFNDLPAEIPHEIENCQLESLVLQTLASKKGKGFSELNSKLLYRAPQPHIDSALNSLYRLGLIGPRGHITRLGEEVSDLPVEVRTGKALALAQRKSDELRLAPDQLIIPTIDMVSCMEAKGIVTWESLSATRGGEPASYQARHGRWTKLLDHTHNSDPVAQMKLFQRLLLLRPDQFADWGIHVNHFHAALNIRELICERLNINPLERAARELDQQRLRQIKEFHWAGSIDRIYRFVGQDIDDTRNRLFKPVVEDGHLRTLSKDSVVKGSSFVVAEPITIDREYLDDQPVRLLVMCSAVDTKWLKNNTPPQLQNAVTESMDKSWDSKPKQSDKQRFHRPGPNGRRR